MKLGIDGRVAIVTGGSAGVGLAISRELLENGAAVAVIGRNQEQLENATAQLRAGVPGGKVLAFAADVTLTETPAIWGTPSDDGRMCSWAINRPKRK
jgi:NAD(P)-dependent dehydrogenase (short-subunit alcohol dehydrogenase family)